MLCFLVTFAPNALSGDVKSEQFVTEFYDGKRIEMLWPADANSLSPLLSKRLTEPYQKAFALKKQFTLWFDPIVNGQDAKITNLKIHTANVFSILTELSQLEQIIYASHYDKNPIEGSPRRGWVKVGLIVDLSVLVDKRVEGKASELRTLWSENWQAISVDKKKVEVFVRLIDDVRRQIKVKLSGLG